MPETNENGVVEPEFSTDPVQKSLAEVKKAREFLRKKEKAAKIAQEKQKINEHPLLKKELEKLREENKRLADFKNHILTHHRDIYSSLPASVK